MNWCVYHNSLDREKKRCVAARIVSNEELWWNKIDCLNSIARSKDDRCYIYLYIYFVTKFVCMCVSESEYTFRRWEEIINERTGLIS